jgi:hypothetical protein
VAALPSKALMMWPRWWMNWNGAGVYAETESDPFIKELNDV